MRRAPRNGISALIGTARRQIWLQCGAHATGRYLRVSAALLLGIGLWHLFATPVASGWIAAALLPLLLGLPMTLLRQRPDAAAAARAADRWFNGKSLIVSAWDLLQHPAHEPAIQSPSISLVLTRAERAASQWRDQVKSIQPLQIPPMTLPLLIAATGLFLLQLPSKGWLTPLQGVEISHDNTVANGAPGGATPIPAQLPATTSTLTPAHDATTPAPRPSEGGEHAPTVASTADNSFQPLPIATGSRPSAPMRVAAVGNSGGKEAGNQQGTQSPAAGKTADTPQTIHESAIERRGTAEGRSREGFELAAAESAGVVTSPLPAIIPAARPGHTPYEGEYTPAQRSYMARYHQERNRQAGEP